jgi:hypothetical protein
MKEARMRIAAGILMIIFGTTMIGIFVYGLRFDIHGFDLAYIAFKLFLIYSCVFTIIGGVFCLMRKYWKLCFASALLPIVIMILRCLAFPPSSSWLTWVFILAGILPIIFVCFSKREWQEIPA